MDESQKLRWVKPQAYEAFMGRWSRILAREFVAFAGVEAGDRVLDVGSGTASVVAAALDRGSHVVGLEPSDEFRSFAQARWPAARFEAGDAQSLPFASGSFDACLSMLVLNFVPDPAAAAAEMRRVARPGGRVAAAVWDYMSGMDMLRLIWDAVVELDPEASDRHEGRMRVSQAGDLSELWREVGLERVEDGELLIDTPFASFDDFWLPLLMEVGPAGAYVASLAEERRQALRNLLFERLGPGPFLLRARAWAVRGSVPGG